MTSFTGRVVLHNVFFHSPRCSIGLSPTDLSVRRRRELYFKAGA